LSCSIAAYRNTHDDDDDDDEDDDDADGQLRDKDAEMEASAARLQQLETCVSEQDSAVSRQLVDKISSSLRLQSQTDVVAQLTADLLKMNRENDILENCLKACYVLDHRRCCFLRLLLVEI